jgi:hypothetical protein
MSGLDLPRDGLLGWGNHTLGVMGGIRSWAHMSKHHYVRCWHLFLLFYTLPSCPNINPGWAISTGAKRDINGIADLKNGKIGVSRIGSGSYVMGFVLADTQSWLSSSSSKDPFEVVPLNTFEALRKGVNKGTADFFMWEHFTSKRYYDNGEIKRIGEIYTPWSSWKIVAATCLLSAPGSGSGSGDKAASDPRLEELFEKLNQGTKYFVEHQDEAVEYISTALDYSQEDTREWLKTVEFASNVRGVDLSVIQKTSDVLRKAGVLGKESMRAEDMIGGQFGVQRPGRMHNLP